MHDNCNPTINHPSTSQLVKASVIALLLAMLVLFAAVLPAEYGKDPTGMGGLLGLTQLHSVEALPVLPAIVTPSAIAPAVIASQKLPGQSVPGQALPGQSTPEQTDASQSFNLDAVRAQSNAFRSDEMSLTLEPGKGAEVKAKMQDGASFVFSWVANGGPVNFDMHGEKPDDGDRFTSYWLDNQKTEAHGRFIAPFTGVHGWYWKNKGTAPVTITVKVSGYFEQLYRP